MRFNLGSVTIDFENLANAIIGDRPSNLPIGEGTDETGQWVTVFLNTDTDGKVTVHGKDKRKIRLNFRPSRRS